MLVERHSGKCQICETLIHDDAEGNPETYASVTAIDRRLPETLENSTILCVNCCGRAALDEHVDHARKRYQQFGWPKKRKLPVSAEATQKLIDKVLELRGDVEFPLPIFVPIMFRNLSDDRIEHIALRMIAVQKRMNEATPRKSKPKVMWIRKHRHRLYELQNGGCYYCAYPLTLDTPLSLDYATIEHLENRRDGGSNSRDNLVVACPICNGYRDEMNMTPEEYRDFVRQHPELVERKRRVTTNNRKGKRANKNWKKRLALGI